MAIVGLSALLADTGWAAITIAALGSSAIGAIVGGSLTTWLRGRIELDEAWRTRLIEVADAFLTPLSKAYLAVDQNVLERVAKNQIPLHTPSAELEPLVVSMVKHSRDRAEEAHAALNRVRMVYPSESSAYVDGLLALDALTGELALIEGKQRAQIAVQAFISAIGGDLSLIDAVKRRGDSLTSHRIQALSLVGETPKSFDPKVDASLAEWAIALHEGGALQLQGFAASVHEVVSSKHPGPRPVAPDSSS